MTKNLFRLIEVKMAFMASIDSLRCQIKRRIRRLHVVAINLVAQRNELQNEVNILRQSIGGAVQVLQNGNFAESPAHENAEALQLQQTVREHEVLSPLIVDPVGDDPANLRQFKDLLRSSYPANLNEKEMLKLALFSKLETEIERRQKEEGEFNFHISQ